MLFVLCCVQWHCVVCLTLCEVALCCLSYVVCSGTVLCVLHCVRWHCVVLRCVRWHCVVCLTLCEVALCCLSYVV